MGLRALFEAVGLEQCHHGIEAQSDHFEDSTILLAEVVVAKLIIGLDLAEKLLNKQ